MILYVNIKQLIFDGEYLKIYILDIFMSFWMKMAKIIFLKYGSTNTNCSILTYNTNFY